MRQRRLRLRLIGVVIAVGSGAPAIAGPLSVNLNTAAAFGLLGGTAISNTGTSEVAGYVGVQDSAATITGFYPTGTTVYGPAGIVTPGSTFSNNAYSDFVGAFNAAQLLTPTQFYPDLSVDRAFMGNTVYALPAGVSSTTGIHLMFDAQNDPSEIFVIQTAGAFTANGALTFVLQNQAQADHIYWIIGTSATISVGNSGPMTFDGNILAGQAFTMSASAAGSGALAGTINGCVFAETANTLAGTTHINGCTSAATASTPEPATWGLVFGAGLLLLAASRRRLRQTRPLTGNPAPQSLGMRLPFWKKRNQ